MKQVFYIAVLLATITVTAQDVKLKNEDVRLKDEMVFFNDSPIFRYAKKSMNTELHVYRLSSSDQLMTITVDNNNTETKADDGKKIIFTQQNTTIQSKKFRERKWDFLIALLLEEKVIDLKGDVNLDNLKRFKAKYDENNVNQTMR